MTQMPYSILIDHIPGETRCAILKEDRLVELHIDRTGARHDKGIQAGNIYLGRVINVVPSLQAAFVDIGGADNGYLPLNATFQDDISKAVHKGQSLLVQVQKVGQTDKGPQLTCKIDFKSDNLVLTPNKLGISVSRKFSDPQKRRLFKTVLQKFIPENSGLMVRTSAENLTPENLIQELNSLVERWHSLEKESQDSVAPKLLHIQKPFLLGLWQQLSKLPLAQVLVEGNEAFQTLSRLTDLACSYTNSPPLFQKEGVEEQIDTALQTHITLPGGGSIDIERTKALIAIDVNMGERLEGRAIEGAHLRTNIAAIPTIKEQLVLRNLSGQIFIDFISLRKQGQQAHLLDSLRESFKNDPRTNIHGFSKLGLCEITRSRVGYALDELLLSTQSYHESSQTAFYALIRRLTKGGTDEKIRVGPSLFTLCQSERSKPTWEWLFARLGYKVPLHKDLDLPLTGFVIEKEN